jgi:hypothetical protein
MTSHRDTSRVGDPPGHVGPLQHEPRDANVVVEPGWADPQQLAADHDRPTPWGTNRRLEAGDPDTIERLSLLERAARFINAPEAK